MSRFSYTSDLEDAYVSEASIEEKFVDLETFFNAPSLLSNNFRQMAVRYRHIQYPVTIELGTQEAGFSTAMSPGAHGGYYVLTNSILKFNFPHTGLANIYEADRSVFQCKAKVHQSDANPLDTNSINRYCLGRSNDGGVTWVPYILETSRPAYVCGGEGHQFFDGLQKNPYTGVVYDPFNANRDKHIILEASFGGDSNFRVGASSGDLWIAVMANSNVYGNGFIKVQHFASCRWTENT